MFNTQDRGDGRQFAPSADRNQHDILPVLRQILPATGTVLEIASGTGQHSVHFAQALQHLSWQPSDINPSALKSIEAWGREAALPNLLPPIRLDVSMPPWPLSSATVVLCINMIHISPWKATEGLIEGASGVLPATGLLVTYGAYFIDGRPTAPSNQEFDRALRAQDPQWGVRKLEDVAAEAARRGLAHEQTIDMPGNNFTIVFRKTG